MAIWCVCWVMLKKWKSLMVATCITTNVIFLQATHFVDIDSRDHFYRISLGGPKLPFGVTVFHRESLGSQESYFFGELPGAFVENKYWNPSGSQKPEAGSWWIHSPRSFFSASSGPPEKMVGSWKEDDRSGFLLFFLGNFSGAKCC